MGIELLKTLYIRPYSSNQEIKIVKKPKDTQDRLDTIKEISGYGIPVEIGDDGIADVPLFQIETVDGWYPDVPTKLLNLKVEILPTALLFNGVSSVLSLPEILDKKLQQKVFSMIPLMYMTGGVGLAAPQIDLDNHVFVMDENFDPKKEAKITPRVVFNASYSTPDPAKINKIEGCLSVPGVRTNIMRHDSLNMHYIDISGNNKELTLHGFGAQIVQHEVDHLYGDTVFRHLSKLQKDKFKDISKKLKRSDRRRDHGVHEHK